jgi:hypothetical protein
MFVDITIVKIVAEDKHYIMVLTVCNVIFIMQSNVHIQIVFLTSSWLPSVV